MIRVATAAILFSLVAPAQNATESVIEIRLIERRVGREIDRLTRVGEDMVLTADVDIVDRGTPIKSSSTLRVGADFSPQGFRLQGRTYRFVNVDADLGAAAAPAPWFPARGWAPLGGRALLINYWEKQKRPATIATKPDGANVQIAYRGEDEVEGGGQRWKLRRYSVDGVVWGRETVWLDDRGALAAIVTRIHVLPMEGVREDLREAFPTLQASSIADRMNDLRALAKAVAPVASGRLALTGARVVDPARATTIDDAVVVIGDGRITAVGPRTSTSIPSGVRTLDVRGATILPGLWDMHAHASQIEWAPAYLAAGVTTVRDMGGETAFLTAFRDALAEGTALGPRLLLAGVVDGPGDEGFGATVAATPEEGRAVVDRLRAAGFQQVKLYSLLAPDVVRAIAAYAHAGGMTVTGHVPRALTAATGVEAGMDQIAHLPVRGNAESAENKALIAGFVTRRTVIDPTLTWSELLGYGVGTDIASFEPGITRIAPALAANYRGVRNVNAGNLAPQLAAIKAMHSAGVRLVVGTDAAVPGFSVLRELELFVKAGLTPMQAVAAATSAPADAMGLARDVGLIEVGKRADLIVLDADPTLNISNIRRIRWVMSGGRVFEPAKVAAAAGFH